MRDVPTQNLVLKSYVVLYMVNILKLICAINKM